MKSLVWAQARFDPRFDPKDLHWRRGEGAEWARQAKNTYLREGHTQEEREAFWETTEVILLGGDAYQMFKKPGHSTRFFGVRCRV